MLLICPYQGQGAYPEQFLDGQRHGLFALGDGLQDAWSQETYRDQSCDVAGSDAFGLSQLLNGLNLARDELHG